MKYFLLLLIASVFAGCTGNDIEINGTADGITDATIILKDGSGQTISGVNIKGGTFHVPKTHLDYPGYGSLIFSRPGEDDLSFELYLEPGLYTVKLDKAKLNSYPQVTSNSPIQNQLSDYKLLFEKMSWDANQKVKALEEKFQQAVRSTPGWGDSTTALSNRVETERKDLTDVSWRVLLAYINKYPQNDIAAHMMQSMSMDLNPTAYYNVYQKFSPAQKNSDEGKDIGERLKALIRLKPGAMAPTIAGTMPDGKPFNLKSLHKKLILVEFWKAGNFQSRLNHQAMFKNPPPLFMHFNDLGIVSISFDKKRDWWLGSMRDDKLTWPQLSDLKGTDSPNFTNWDIQNLPTYWLLDGTGHIIERDLQLSEISIVAAKYLKDH
ncbi:TlpA family protein disulfide reductase [Mucilaginibacter sp. UYCu711]|uniref:TlpA family protein disulfide reductase n=1 Tax=Mucilaginibacter sp. UYCu711 TaxID=3156339 RepID=UPI003D2150DC